MPKDSRKFSINVVDFSGNKKTKEKVMMSQDDVATRLLKISNERKLAEKVAMKTTGSTLKGVGLDDLKSIAGEVITNTVFNAWKSLANREKRFRDWKNIESYFVSAFSRRSKNPYYASLKKKRFGAECHITLYGQEDETQTADFVKTSVDYKKIRAAISDILRFLRAEDRKLNLKEAYAHVEGTPIKKWLMARAVRSSILGTTSQAVSKAKNTNDLVANQPTATVDKYTKWKKKMVRKGVSGDDIERSLNYAIIQLRLHKKETFNSLKEEYVKSSSSVYGDMSWRHGEMPQNPYDSAHAQTGNTNAAMKSDKDHRLFFKNFVADPCYCFSEDIKNNLYKIIIGIEIKEKGSVFGDAEQQFTQLVKQRVVLSLPKSSFASMSAAKPALLELAKPALQEMILKCQKAAKSHKKQINKASTENFSNIVQSR